MVLAGSDCASSSWLPAVPRYMHCITMNKSCISDNSCTCRNGHLQWASMAVLAVPTNCTMVRPAHVPHSALSCKQAYSLHVLMAGFYAAGHVSWHASVCSSGHMPEQPLPPVKVPVCRAPKATVCCRHTAHAHAGKQRRQPVLPSIGTCDTRGSMNRCQESHTGW